MLACKRTGHRVLRLTFETPTQVRSQVRFFGKRYSIDDPGHDHWEGSHGERVPRTIQIRFSAVPESITDALIALREVERHYGRLREYRLLRDSELSSAYQAICWAAFESPESWGRVPMGGAKLPVSLPPMSRPEGGPSLDDLKHLLKPEERGAGFDFLPFDSKSQSRDSRKMEVSVKRSDKPLTFRSPLRPPYRSRRMKALIGHSFLEWGGFSPLKPLYESSPFTGPAQDPTPIDNINMRMALNKWSQILGIPDPLFPEMWQQPRNDETEPQEQSVSESSSPSRRSVSSTSSRSRLAKTVPRQDVWEPLSEPLSRRRKDSEPDSAEEPETFESMRESLRQSFEDILKGEHSAGSREARGGKREGTT